MNSDTRPSGINLGITKCIWLGWSGWSVTVVTELFSWSHFGVSCSNGPNSSDEHGADSNLPFMMNARLLKAYDLGEMYAKCHIIPVWNNISYVFIQWNPTHVVNFSSLICLTSRWYINYQSFSVRTDELIIILNYDIESASIVSFTSFPRTQRSSCCIVHTTSNASATAFVSPGRTEQTMRFDF